MTKYGEESLIRNGAAKTFVNYSVSDSLNRYDVTGTNNLESTLNGGLRTLVTKASCEFASSKPITKEKPSVEETKKIQQQLERHIQLSDCDKNYTALNPTITVDLKGWFNYLESLLGEENYGYNNKMTQYLFDNI
jgi:hypothetical protein